MGEEKKKSKIMTKILALVLVAIVILTIGTYALWQQTRKQSRQNALGTACLDITFENESGDINLSGQWPKSDSEGSALVPYKFTVANHCDTPVNYTIYIESIGEVVNDVDLVPGKALTDSDYLNPNFIKVKIDTEGPVKLGTLPTATNDNPSTYTVRDTRSVIAKTVNGNESNNHELRLWVAEDTPLYNDPETKLDANTNKYFFSKVKIIGGQAIQTKCYSVSSDGVLYAYDKSCGTSVTIPAAVDGNQVKTIATDAFKEYKINYTYKRDGSTLVSGIDEIASGTCNTIDGTKACTLDMSLAVSDKVIPAFIDQSQLSTVIPTLTTNDVYFIKYNNDLTAEQESALKSFLWSATNFDQLSQMGLTFGLNDTTIYTTGNKPAEGNGTLEWYGASNYSGGWSGNFLGSKETDGSGSEPTLVINSLDLSEATNLEKIEDRAFSNVNLPDDLQNFNLNDIPVGLTSLTLGSNSRNIEFGWAAFAKSNLNTLTLYSGNKIKNIDSFDDTKPNDKYGFIFGVFGGSTIGTLNINSSGGQTSYSPAHKARIAYPSSYLSATPGESEGALIGMFAGVLSKTNITTLNIDNSFTEIGYDAFLNTEIGTLNLPSALTTIKDYAFFGYQGNGQTIYLPSAVTTIGTDAFDDFRGTIYVPSQSLVDSKADWASLATVLLNS